MINSFERFFLWNFRLWYLLIYYLLADVRIQRCLATQSSKQCLINFSLYYSHFILLAHTKNMSSNPFLGILSNYKYPWDLRYALESKFEIYGKNNNHKTLFKKKKKLKVSWVIRFFKWKHIILYPILDSKYFVSVR